MVLVTTINPDTELECSMTVKDQEQAEAIMNHCSKFFGHFGYAVDSDGKLLSVCDFGKEIVHRGNPGYEELHTKVCEFIIANSGDYEETTEEYFKAEAKIS